MVCSISRNAGTPAAQAATILRAWGRRDEEALRSEFARIIDPGWSVGGSDPAGEQTELLKTVVTELNNRPNLLHDEHGDSLRQTCLNLLMHLAALSAAA